MPDPLTPEEYAAHFRQEAEAGAIQFHCTACPEVVSIGDYDQSHRADWLRDMIETQGWIETPSGLVCDCCASRPDDATTH